MEKREEKRFVLWSFASIFFLFLLILAGGVVRSSGSGMGCPDWPRCFNRIIPPVSESQLPANYQREYVLKRINKNEKAAKLFDLFGWHLLANRMRNDPSVKEPGKFNVFNTYTEYINRLLGAVSGVLFLITWVYALKYRKFKPRIFYAWSLAVLFMGIQGYLGSLVVSTNLLGFLITIHMLLALVILTLAIYCFTRASLALSREVLIVGSKSGLFFFILFSVILLTAFQILTGAQLRESIDVIARKLSGLHRDVWVLRTGDIFSWHRELSVLVMIGNAVIYNRIKRTFIDDKRISKVGIVNLYLIVIQMFTGITLAYFDLPPVSQSLHIFVASLIFGNLVHIWFLSTSPGRTQIQEQIFNQENFME